MQMRLVYDSAQEYFKRASPVRASGWMMFFDTQMTLWRDFAYATIVWRHGGIAKSGYNFSRIQQIVLDCPAGLLRISRYSIWIVNNDKRLDARTAFVVWRMPTSPRDSSG